jgi:hypothetical protein
VLGTKWVVPDAGRLRLRGALRAVLGIGSAVAVCALTGHSLGAVIAGGLAALLALFAVTDPTVRGQVLTTALLPAAGLPVLALAAVLQGQPPARDLAFLAVAAAAVYARRWGPRGHALGVFAFMAFFLAQFLHTVPGQLPGLYSAVLLALAASSAVRFGAWCYERRLPVPAAAAPSARVALRQTVQVAVAMAFALAVGQLLSQDRSYWAVGAAWWIFVNTASRGETLVRGFRRVVGTIAGIAAGLLLAVPLHGAAAPTALLAATCVFGIFYTAAVSYSWMMFFVTVLVSLLYGLLGVLDPGLLALRLAETGVGALGAVLAVALVLPITTHATTDGWIQQALRSVHRCTAEAAARLAGSPAADPAPRIAELDRLLARVRLSLAPLVHPLSPLRARRARARRVLALLDDCAREVRALACVAADPDASQDARLAAACWRVEAAVRALTSADGARELAAATAVADGPPALVHLHGLETALRELATPLRGGRRPLRSAAAG